MTHRRGPPGAVGFGVFDLDPAAGELRKAGVRVNLQDQPFEVLRLLLERPGELVTREEIERDLWPDDAYGDLDQRLNVAVTKIRTALGDSAESPRFVETVPRRGYRFIAPVEPLAGKRRRIDLRTAVLGLLGLLLAAGGYLGWRTLRSAGSEPAARVVLAVLPFEHLGGSVDDDYFSDGLTEEMIMQLGKVSPQHIGVIARTSIKSYKGTEKSIQQIGDELGADYVLEGTVRRQASRVRIVAQLIDAQDQTHLWADAYENELSSILSIQQEVAQAVASSLTVDVLSTKRGSSPPQATDTAAYEAYLRGRHFRDQHTEAGYERSVEAFQLAIRADPGYAPAYAGLASCSCLLSGHGMEVRSPLELMLTAKRMALQALELDDSLAEAHAVLAMAHLKYDWDFPRAEQEFRRTLELNPSYALGRLWYSIFLEAMGRPEEAVVQARMGRELDPLSLEANTNLGMQLLGAGRDEEGLEWIRAALELDPNFWGAYWALGQYHLRRQSFEEASRAFDEAVRLSSGNTVSIASLGHARALAGQRAEALAALDRLRALGERRYVSPAQVAIVHGALDEADEAFVWLERAYEQRSRYLVWMAVSPEFSQLRSDRRYHELVARIGL